MKKKIAWLFSDVDGVLTDGGMYYSANGEELKKFSTRDGMGVRLIRERGVSVGLITGEKSQIVERRAEKIGVDILLQGVSQKFNEINRFLAEKKVALNEVAFIGDDINDLEFIKAVTFSAAPADAMDAVKREAKYICRRPGGRGALREWIDHLILEGLV